MTGRRVRTLVRGGRFPAGGSEVSWDRRADGGSVAPAGIYLVRVRAGSETAIARIVLL